MSDAKGEPTTIKFAFFLNKFCLKNCAYFSFSLKEISWQILTPFTFLLIPTKILLTTNKKENIKTIFFPTDRGHSFLKKLMPSKNINIKRGYSVFIYLEFGYARIPGHPKNKIPKKEDYGYACPS